MNSGQASQFWTWRMGLPREYLNFALWYLKAKGYVCYEDDSD